MGIFAAFHLGYLTRFSAEVDQALLWGMSPDLFCFACHAWIFLEEYPFLLAHDFRILRGHSEHVGFSLIEITLEPFEQSSFRYLCVFRTRQSIAGRSFDGFTSAVKSWSNQPKEVIPVKFKFRGNRRDSCILCVLFKVLRGLRAQMKMEGDHHTVVPSLLMDVAWAFGLVFQKLFWIYRRMGEISFWKDLEKHGIELRNL